MKAIQTVELEPIFPHERTELFRRTCELHRFATQLLSEAGSTRDSEALARLGLLAMMSTASAGVAVGDRARARHLATLRDRLARYACTLRGLANRGLIDAAVFRFGATLVQRTEALVADFDLALRCVETELLVARKDAERARNGIGVANDGATGGASLDTVPATGSDGAAPPSPDGAVAETRHNDGTSTPSSGERTETTSASESGHGADHRKRQARRPGR